LQDSEYRQTDQNSVTVVKPAEDKGPNELPHTFDLDVTFQLPEPAQVVKTRTCDPVYQISSVFEAFNCNRRDAHQSRRTPMQDVRR